MNNLENYPIEDLKEENILSQDMNLHIKKVLKKVLFYKRVKRYCLECQRVICLSPANIFKKHCKKCYFKLFPDKK